jgi:hypothetical protein
MTLASWVIQVRTEKWLFFSRAWNDIVTHLRETDIISNDERDMLLFHKLEGSVIGV